MSFALTMPRNERLARISQRYRVKVSTAFSQAHATILVESRNSFSKHWVCLGDGMGKNTLKMATKHGHHQASGRFAIASFAIIRIAMIVAPPTTLYLLHKLPLDW